MEFVRALQSIEQELRLPRTPLELAEAETSDVPSRPSPVPIALRCAPRR